MAARGMATRLRYRPGHPAVGGEPREGAGGLLSELRGPVPLGARASHPHSRTGPSGEAGGPRDTVSEAGVSLVVREQQGGRKAASIRQVSPGNL